MRIAPSGFVLPPGTAKPLTRSLTSLFGRTAARQRRRRRAAECAGCSAFQRCCIGTGARVAILPREPRQSSPRWPRTLLRFYRNIADALAASPRCACTLFEAYRVAIDAWHSKSSESNPANFRIETARRDEYGLVWIAPSAQRADEHDAGMTTPGSLSVRFTDPAWPPQALSCLGEPVARRRANERSESCADQALMRVILHLSRDNRCTSQTVSRHRSALYRKVCGLGDPIRLGRSIVTWRRGADARHPISRSGSARSDASSRRRLIPCTCVKIAAYQDRDVDILRRTITTRLNLKWRHDKWRDCHATASTGGCLVLTAAGTDD